MPSSLAQSYSSQALAATLRLGASPLTALQAPLSEEEIGRCWNALGHAVARALRLGRGVRVEGFGTFTIRPDFTRSQK
jgi:hypothetical protein